jgi:hypothetical protein
MAVFFTSNDGGSAALLGSGAFLVAVSLIGDRIDGFEAAGVKVSLRASAERALREANEAEAAGDLERADALRLRADALLSTVQDLSDRYEEVRSVQSKSGGRTMALEQIVAEAKSLAYRPETSASSVEFLFNTGRAGNRVSALAIMDERPHLASPAVILDALTGPRSAFEMYTALSAARSYMASGLPSRADQDSIATIVRTQLEGGRLGAANSDRVALATEIIRRFGTAG